VNFLCDGVVHGPLSAARSSKIDMKLAPLHLGIAAAVAGLLVIGGLIWRERSWRYHSYNLQQQVHNATFDMESALLLMQVQQLHGLKCQNPATSLLNSPGHCFAEFLSSQAADREQKVNEFVVSHSPEKIAAFFKETEATLNGGRFE
jgi:hypothetical protein